MTPEELAAIRERDKRRPSTEEMLTSYPDPMPFVDRHALLAHIDAITEAVEGLEPTLRREPPDYYYGYDDARSAVLALLRGTPQR